MVQRKKCSKNRKNCIELNNLTSLDYTTQIEKSGEGYIAEARLEKKNHPPLALTLVRFRQSGTGASSNGFNLGQKSLGGGQRISLRNLQQKEGATTRQAAKGPLPRGAKDMRGGAMT